MFNIVNTDFISKRLFNRVNCVNCVQFEHYWFNLTTIEGQFSTLSTQTSISKRLFNCLNCVNCVQIEHYWFNVTTIEGKCSTLSTLPSSLKDCSTVSIVSIVFNLSTIDSIWPLLKVNVQHCQNRLLSLKDCSTVSIVSIVFNLNTIDAIWPLLKVNVQHCQHWLHL